MRLLVAQHFAEQGMDKAIGQVQPFEDVGRDIGIDLSKGVKRLDLLLERFPLTYLCSEPVQRSNVAI